MLGSTDHHRDVTEIDGDENIWKVRWRKVDGDDLGGRKAS